MADKEPVAGLSWAGGEHEVPGGLEPHLGIAAGISGPSGLPSSPVHTPDMSDTSLPLCTASKTGSHWNTAEILAFGGHK